MYLMVMVFNFSMCHRVFLMLADKKFSTSQRRAMFSLLLCHILGLCTYAAVLITDVKALINKTAVDLFKVSNLGIFMLLNYIIENRNLVDHDCLFVSNNKTPIESSSPMPYK